MVRTNSQKFLVAALASVALLFLLVAVVYVFGTPQSSPSSSGATPLELSGSAATEAPSNGEPTTQAPVGQAPAMGAAPEGTTGMGDVAKPDPDAEAPAPDPSSPLAIEIPGCVCHSDDPGVVERHSAYRMNQCAGCHIGGVDTN